MELFFADDELPKTAESFESRLEKSRSKLAPAFFQTLDLFADVIKLRFEVYRSLQDLESVSYKPACDHIGSWISQLVPNDFLLSTPGSLSNCCLDIWKELNIVWAVCPASLKR